MMRGAPLSVSTEQIRVIIRTRFDKKMGLYDTI